MQIKLVTRYTHYKKFKKKTLDNCQKILKIINTAGLVIKTNFVKTWSGTSHTKW